MRRNARIKKPKSAKNFHLKKGAGTCENLVLSDISESLKKDGNPSKLDKGAMVWILQNWKHEWKNCAAAPLW